MDASLLPGADVSPTCTHCTVRSMRHFLCCCHRRPPQTPLLTNISAARTVRQAKWLPIINRFTTMSKSSREPSSSLSPQAFEELLQAVSRCNVAESPSTLSECVGGVGAAAAAGRSMPVTSPRNGSRHRSFGGRARGRIKLLGCFWEGRVECNSKTADIAGR